MKCNCFIKHVERRRKGSGEAYQAIDPRATITWWQQFHNPDIKPDVDHELCNGNIIATVEAVDEPYFGGSSASLEITFKCDRCGNSFFPNLPTEADSLNRFLTEAIARLDEEPLIAAAKARHHAEQARRAELMEQGWLNKLPAKLRETKK